MFFKKKQPLHQKSLDEVDFEPKIDILLTKDYELEISLELKDINIKNETENLEKAQKLAEFFFTINSGGLKYNLTKMLVEQIGTDENSKKFVEYIILYWTVLEKNYEKTTQKKNIETPVISPMQVFGKYMGKD